MMNMPRLLIETTDAQIGLRPYRPPLQIKQHQADLQIRQRHVDIIEMSTTASKLYIDQTEAFADANLKTPLRLANEYWKKANETALEYIAKTAREGIEMMRIEDGGDAIQRIAKRNSLPPPKEATLAWMPRSMSQVKFTYVPGELKIEAPFEEAEITVIPRPPEIRIPKWETNVYLRQKNSIRFEVVGTTVDRKV